MKKIADILFTARWAISNGKKELAYDEITKALTEIGALPSEDIKVSSDFKVAVVVGHTQKAGGAWGADPLNMNEYTYNSEIAQRLYRRLKENNIDCRIFFRDDVGIKGAYNQVNLWAADARKSCCLELHFNAYNGRVQGSETLYDSKPAENKEFASMVHEEIASAFNRRDRSDRGIKLVERGDRGHYNMYSAEIVSCLPEPFFGDNKEDAKMAHDRKHEYVDALFNGVTRWLNN